MANTMDKLAKELKNAMTASDERKPKPYDAQAEVLRVEDGVAWVHIPGGVEETPVRLTINAKKGDMVNIHVANGSAWITGNGTNPPTDDSTANYALNVTNDLSKDVVVLNTVVAENIEATNARFGTVEADTAKIHDLTADQLTATVGYIGDLTADNVTAAKLTAAEGYISTLVANDITAQSIAADHATIDSLDSNYAHITNGVIDNASISYADVDNLSANYAQINGANINTATIRNNWVNQLMVQTGLIASEGAVYYLDAIQVNATNITAGTIDVERLIVTVDGEKYLIHIDPTTSQTSYEKLDGDVIEDLTITADKIVAGAITAEKITTENIVGSGGWINLRNGTFNYTNATSGNYITWDGTNLNISATNISLGSQSLSNTLEALQNEIDGAIETWYYSVDPTLSNAPASSWTTDDAKNTHLRDLYFNTTNGHSFRWAIVQTSDASIVSGKTYYTYNSSTGLYTAVTNPTASGLPQYYEFKWIQIEDADAIKALADAAAAQETANGAEALAGTKRRVFVTTPTPPYDIGDLWAEGSTGDLKKCKTAKTTGQSYSASDWELATKYTDDSNVYTKSDFSITPEQIIGKVTKTELNLTGQYATCSTAQGTAAKVAVIQPNITGWEIYTGATITVKFTNANTASSPTLNVKGKSSDTGSAKAIKTYSGGNLSEAEYKWKAGDTFTFTYNGTNWLMQDATVATRMTSAESSITQNAENIELKVSKDGVIASINASTETSGGSAVTINADKVNIAGAALFTSGRLSESSLNAAYDANGAAATAESNAKTYADTGIISTTTLYYASNSTTPPSKPSAHVTTNSASTRGAWNIALPTYSDSYPYLYVCTETKTKGGTYAWTSVEQTSYTSAISSIKTTADSAAPKSNAVSRSQRIYYRKTSSGAPSANTTWLSTSGTGYGNWSLSIPQLTSGTTKYPYLYTAVQTQTVAQQAAGNTCSCSTVLLDDTTTVIDGGTIITGTVNANAVNASSGTFNEANIPNLNASKITAGTIAVGVLPDDALNSNIEVGGRNLLKDSENLINDWTFDGGSTRGTGSATLPSTGDGTHRIYQLPSNGYWSIWQANTTYTVSIEAKASVNGLKMLLAPYAGGVSEKTVTLTTSWARYSYTFTSNSNTSTLSCSFINSGNSSGSIEVRNPKLEYGNKATDWTPAPEDVQAEIDAKKTIHLLNSAYLATGATYSVILGWIEDGYSHQFDIDVNTTPLTDVKVGDTVRIRYLANNMGDNGTIVYIVGTVVSKMSTAVIISNIGLESTVIDGGHILTGTLDATKVNVTNLNANNITSGTVSASYLPAEALKTIRTVQRNASATYAQVKSFAALDPCAWTTIVDTTGVRVGDTARVAITVSDMNNVTAYITGTVTAVSSTTAMTMTGQSISSTTIDGGMILSGKVGAQYVEADQLTIGQSQVTDLSTDLNSIRAQYGYTNTAAGTAVKEVVLPNYVDRQGAIIGVRFANGNTASSMKLNVNSTGEKFVQSVDILTDLPAATSANFIRDEYNQWRYLGSDASSKTSKTFAEALSSAKQISTQSRSFTKANWDSYGANGHSESWSANSASGYDNSHISVGDTAYITGTVSDKAGWYAAILGTVTSTSSTAVVMTSIKVLYNSTQTEKYITKIDNNGIFISPLSQAPTSSSAGNSVKINASGMEVYKSGTSVAFYGDTARIGKANNKRLELDSSSFGVVESNGIAQFSVDAGQSSATKTYYRYLDITGGGFTASSKFVAPGVGTTIQVGAATAILNVKSSITTNLTLPTAINGTASVTANNVTFTAKKLGRYVYQLSASASSGTSYYAGFKYTTSSTAALVSVNDSLLNDEQQLYVPVVADVGTLDNCEIFIWGRIAQIVLEVHKSNVGSSSNVFEGTLTDFLPIADAALVGYYGARSAVGYIDTGGSIIVRNASSSSMSPTASTPLVMRGTYIFDPTRTAW